MEKYDLPKGIVKVCAGIVESCSSEPYITAVDKASKGIGMNYSKEAEHIRKGLETAIKLNLINRKEYPYHQLQRKFQFAESEHQFKREKYKFCYRLAKILDLV